MAYSDFTLPKVQADFGLRIETHPDLFVEVPPVALDPAFLASLRRRAVLALSINTEKARSEWLIAPLLAEVWERAGPRVSLYSGLDFNVDPATGLNGTCDYLFGFGPQVAFVSAPVVAIVEAKNESIAGGLGQCAAEMIAAHRFDQREGAPRDTVYGVVTSGSNWKFLRLRPPMLTIGLTEYLYDQADKILGILLHMLEPLPQPRPDRHFFAVATPGGNSSFTN